MKKQSAAPIVVRGVRYYDKQEAADVLGFSVQNMRYHLYTSPNGFLPKGRVMFGRRLWTLAELEEFKSKLAHSRKMENQPNRVTVATLFGDSSMMDQFNNGTLTVTFKGKRVQSIEQDFNALREYYLKIHKGDEVRVFGNTRLAITSNGSNSTKV